MQKIVSFYFLRINLITYLAYKSNRVLLNRNLNGFSFIKIFILNLKYNEKRKKKHYLLFFF